MFASVDRAMTEPIEAELHYEDGPEMRISRHGDCRINFTKWIERYAVVEELDHHVVITCCTYTRMDFRDRRKSTQKTSL